jgi:transcriptional regulator with XRE-family HTH domain
MAGIFMEISEKLVLIRNKKGWNQTKTAQELGVAQTMISAIERGMRKPSKRLAAQINELVEPYMKADPPIVDVGLRILDAMRVHKISQAEMGAYLGISQAAVSAWGKGCDPGSDKIVKIAERIGCSVGYLLTGVDVTTLPVGGVSSPEEVAVLRALVVSQQRTIEAQADTIRAVFKGRDSGVACG